MRAAGIKWRKRNVVGAVLAAVLTAASSWTAYAGWELDDTGNWTHRAENGEPDTGWFQEADGGWYYLGEDGRLRTGQWISGAEGAWYYLHVDGRMLAGQWFQETDGKWYYLGADGAMLKSCTTPDGYWVQADGTWDGRAAASGGKSRVLSGGGSGGSGGSGSSSSGNGGSDNGGSSGSSSSGNGGSDSSSSAEPGSGDAGTGGSPDGSGNWMGDVGFDSGNSVGNSGEVAGSGDGMADVAEGKDHIADDAAVTLASWFALARTAEAAVTGEPPESIPDSRFLVSDAGGQDTRLITAAGRLAGSAWTDTPFADLRQELYLIGKNWIPDGIVLSITYPDEISYSHQNLDSVSIGGEIYTLSKFILVRQSDKDSIEQDQDEVSGSSGYWKEGDVLEREIDGETYRFRCIDQNYSDGIQEKDGLALFFCDQVIPADYGSEYEPAEDETGSFVYQFVPGPLVQFGASREYKHSDIRRWLKNSESDCSDAQPVQVGVSYAYSGSTGEGLYEALDDAGLRAAYLGSQRMTDRLFILSVEEALEYRDWLWNFGGEADPESQISSFCKGYWLRSPATAPPEDEQEMVYVVDLVHGNLHPEPVAPLEGLGAGEEADMDLECQLTGTTGVRPAFVMQQKYVER